MPLLGESMRPLARGAIICAVALSLASLPAAPAVSTAAPASSGLNKIDHIVFIVKENRSFDHYFGRFPGADGATSGRTSNGEVMPLTEAPDQVLPDVGHSLPYNLVLMQRLAAGGIEEQTAVRRPAERQRVA